MLQKLKILGIISLFLISITMTGKVYPMEHLPVSSFLETKNKEIECMSQALFWEVRRSSLYENILVANVIMNRKKSGEYPDDICKIVKQKSQFEFVSKGLYGIDKVNRRIQNEAEKKAWETAQFVAKLAVTKKLKDVSGGAIAYHANTMKKPKSSFWVSLKTTRKTDLHTFYTPKNDV